MNHKKGFSIVIPVLNEKRNLSNLIPDIYKVVVEKKFEIIVVDDNSDDGTKQYIQKLIKKKKFNNFC